MRLPLPTALFLVSAALSARAVDFVASPLPEAIARLNERAEAAEDPDTRIRLYATALKRDMSNEPARYAIACHFLSHGAPAKALFLARGLAASHPESVDVLFLRARAALALLAPSRSELLELADDLAACARDAADNPARRAEALLYQSACVRLTGGFSEAPAIARHAGEAALEAGLPMAPYVLEKDLADEAASLFRPVE